MVFGCGYLGRRVARRWLTEGTAVQVVTRSPLHADEFRKAGFGALVADITKPDSLVALSRPSTVLFAVGYDRTSGDSIEDVYVQGLSNVLNALPDSVERFVYISSTGVYGASGEAWVDEASVCKPERPGGKACLAAERLLQEHPLGDRAIIMRLAGIYGPGRVPQREALAKGKAKAPPLDSYLNLIHVDDAADCVIAAERKAVPPELFVVSDGNPVLRRDYYEEVLRLCGLDQALMSRIQVSASSRGRSSKRVRNSKLISDLKMNFSYPSYREGLAQAIAAP